MKSSQKGSVGIGLLAIAVVVLLGVGVGYSLKHVFVQTGQTPVPSSTQPNAPSQASPVTTSMESCGRIVNAPSSNIEQQAQNAAVYSCMSHAIVTCSPATMTQPNPPGAGMKTFTILSGNGSFCPVSETIDSPALRMTCNIPSDFISAMARFLQEKNQSGMLFYTIPFFFVPPSTPSSAKPIVKNPMTDQTVIAQCSLM